MFGALTALIPISAFVCAYLQVVGGDPDLEPDQNSILLRLTPNWGGFGHLESQGSEENEKLRLGGYAQHAIAHREM